MVSLAFHHLYTAEFGQRQPIDSQPNLGPSHDLGAVSVA